MRSEGGLTSESFEALLDWFDADDRESAGTRYEEIRAGLIRFFRFRGAADPSVLADETINRVAAKLQTFDSDARRKYLSLFYGFASKVWLEQGKARRLREVSLDDDLPDGRPIHPEDDDGEAVKCLEQCLERLQGDDSSLVLTYYSKNKTEGMRLRRALAEKRDLKIGALHTKIFRIRDSLRACISECLKAGSCNDSR